MFEIWGVLVGVLVMLLGGGVLVGWGLGLGSFKLVVRLIGLFGVVVG